MTMGPVSREQAVRQELAGEWHRKQCPITQLGEELLAERLAMEARHALERRQWETRFARYLMQQIRPMEYRKQKSSGAPSEPRNAA